ncbi:DUF268 domain-containing protein [Chitiniphilus purpureus]|uniref:DUF268 domain-containing protein n=1 Tax=Chitiniphilus purpureus TaxID=2981137 RepID=A0ABY6DPI9_9NEIS|nr:DUF268 domain-containing protein [Chitiniphilus sp. CD1]UXY15608.1 DUF268 domain-containing protein [Chitiniphilus sp. CD1]
MNSLTSTKTCPPKWLQDGRQLRRSLHRLLEALGLNLPQLWHGIRALPQFCRNYRKLSQLIAGGTDFPLTLLHPCLHDRRDSSGNAKGHYFHQDLLVAKRIYSARPVRHLDVGSRIDGFVAHCAVFREIEVMDIRPLISRTPNIYYAQADLMSPPVALAGQFDSVSCLHALEHFGLGRYGDQLDPAGHRHGLNSLATLLKPGGTLYLSVPIGPQRIEFDAHRVFAISTLLELLAPQFDIRYFSFVDDDGDLHENVALTGLELDNNFGCFFGCGIFELVKKSSD